MDFSEREIQGVSTEVYFATIALERNRWKTGTAPSILASDWAGRVRDAGFDGLELWAGHYLRADPAEQALLSRPEAGVRVFNSYLAVGRAAPEDTASLGNAVRSFLPGIRGIKFNLGGPPATLDAEIAAASALLDAAPPSVGLWCECHGGTVTETPEAASVAFSRWGDRFGAILHPIGMPAERMRAWFEATGGRVRHLHLQPRDANGRFIRMDRCATAVADAFAELRSLGFSGSASVEFVEGNAAPGEEVDRSFENAVADLAFLRRIS